MCTFRYLVYRWQSSKIPVGGVSHWGSKTALNNIYIQYYVTKQNDHWCYIVKYVAN